MVLIELILSELIGDTPTINAQKILKLLDGEKGAFRNIVVINAAAAIYVFGIAENIKHGVELANKSIDEGKLKSSLEKLVKASNEKLIFLIRSEIIKLMK